MPRLSDKRLFGWRCETKSSARQLFLHKAELVAVASGFVTRMAVLIHISPVCTDERIWRHVTKRREIHWEKFSFSSYNFRWDFCGTVDLSNIFTGEYLKKMIETIFLYRYHALYISFSRVLNQHGSTFIGHFDNYFSSFQWNYRWLF